MEGRGGDGRRRRRNVGKVGSGGREKREGIGKTEREFGEEGWQCEVRGAKEKRER